MRLTLGIALLTAGCTLPFSPSSPCTPGVAASAYVTETTDGAVVTVESFAMCVGFDEHLAIRHLNSARCWQVAQGAGPYPRLSSRPFEQHFHADHFKPSRGSVYELIVHKVGAAHEISWRQPIGVR